MKSLLLKLYLIFFLSLLFSIVVEAQNFRFIYIQTENQKPFYIKIDGQTLVSSSSGYVIVPHLTQSSYKSYIGFPQSILSEFSVTLVINDNNVGYLLQQDIEQGLYMYDLVTKKRIVTEVYSPPANDWEIVKSKDEFAKILAEVVNDSSITETKVYQKPAEAIVKYEENKKQNKSINQPKTVINNETEIVTDNNGKITQPVQQRSDEVIPVMQNKKLRVKKDIAVNQKKSMPAIAKPPKQKDSIAVFKTNVIASNPKCKKTATQKDFLELQKKMTAEKTETVKRTLALKQFGTVCYTTEQIKSLGVLFIKEEEKYKFYVSAYSYVADTENFSTLESELADNYYITRFKAMLQH